MPTFRILLLTSLLLFLPVIIFHAAGSDVFTVGLYAKHFARELFSGEIYPRWLPEMFAGHGSPVFFFYPPLAFYLAAIFYPLSALDMFGVHMLNAAAFCAMFLSGIFCYVWLARHVGKRASLLASLFYMMVPFHFSQSFVSSALFSQFVAYAWFPLILMCAERVVKKERFSLIALTGSFSLLLLTNIPNFILFFPLTFFYMLMLTKPSDHLQILLRVIAAAGMMLCLTSFYWMPAFFYQDFTLIARQWNTDQGLMANTQLLSWDVSSAETRMRTFSYMSDFIISAALLCGMTWTLLRTETLPLMRYRFAWWWLVGMVALLMNLSISAPVWEAVPLLKIVQIPSRFMMLVALALTALIAAFAERFSSRAARAFIYGLFAVCYAQLLIVSYMKHIDEDEFAREAPLAYQRYQMDVEQYRHYLPGMDAAFRFFNSAALKKIEEHNPLFEVISGDAEVDVLAWKAREISLHVSAVDTSRIRVRQLFFPGWVALDMRHDSYIPLQREEEGGRIVLDIPKEFGSGIITLSLTSLWPEALGKFISCLMLLVGGVWWGVIRMREGENTRMQEK